MKPKPNPGNGKGVVVFERMIAEASSVERRDSGSGTPVERPPLSCRPMEVQRNRAFDRDSRNPNVAGQGRTDMMDAVLRPERKRERRIDTTARPRFCRRFGQTPGRVRDIGRKESRRSVDGRKRPIALVEHVGAPRTTAVLADGMPANRADVNGGVRHGGLSCQD